MPMLVPAFEAASLVESDAALQTTLTLLEKNRSTRSLRWLLTPNSIHTDIICMKPPPRVHSDHVGRPDHSAGHAVSDDRRRGKHDQHCTGWYADGGFAILRGPYRRTRSRPLARPRVVPCSGRRGRLVHNLRRSAQTVIYTYQQNPASRPTALRAGKLPAVNGSPVGHPVCPTRAQWPREPGSGPMPMSGQRH